VDVALLYKGHCIMDFVKLNFNDIISLYTNNDSECKRFVSQDILYCNYILL